MGKENIFSYFNEDQTPTVAREPFVILSYGSGRRAPNDDRNGWARCEADRLKLAATRLWIGHLYPDWNVWVDCCSGNLEPRAGAEQYNFDPMKTLGKTYEHAILTVSILENKDAAWLQSMAQANAEGRDLRDDSVLAGLMQANIAWNFSQDVKKHKFSYWNRAWILQEVLQSQTILYVGWDRESCTLTPIIDTVALAEALHRTNFVRDAELDDDILISDRPRYYSQERDKVGPVVGQRLMLQWLQQACPPRDRCNASYSTQADLYRSICSRTYFAADRRNALLAVAILLGLTGPQEEESLAESIHSYMIRSGFLPITPILQRDQTELPPQRREQTFNDSGCSWAPAFIEDTDSTEELRYYIPSPAGAELLNNGMLKIVCRALCGYVTIKHKDMDKLEEWQYVIKPNLPGHILTASRLYTGGYEFWLEDGRRQIAIGRFLFDQPLPFEVAFGSALLWVLWCSNVMMFVAPSWGTKPDHSLIRGRIIYSSDRISVHKQAAGAFEVKPFLLE